jgi:hypothetical protein
MRVDRFYNITIQYFSTIILRDKNTSNFQPLFNRLLIFLDHFNHWPNLASPKIALAME